MQKIDSEMEKYEFHLVNDKSPYEVNLHLPKQMASILLFVYNYKSPFETRKLGFQSPKNQFDAEVTFGQKNDGIDIIGLTSLKNIHVLKCKFDPKILVDKYSKQ